MWGVGCRQTMTSTAPYGRDPPPGEAPQTTLKSLCTSPLSGPAISPHSPSPSHLARRSLPRSVLGPSHPFLLAQEPHRSLPLPPPALLVGLQGVNARGALPGARPVQGRHYKCGVRDRRAATPNRRRVRAVGRPGGGRRCVSPAPRRDPPLGSLGAQSPPVFRRSRKGKGYGVRS